MTRQQIQTKQRSRAKVSRTMPVTGTVPSILDVSPVAGQTSQIEITFNTPVIINTVPPWTATVGGNPIAPVSVVSQTTTSIILNYGVDVSTATTLVVPEKDQSARSATAQRVAAGSYPLA